MKRILVLATMITFPSMSLANSEDINTAMNLLKLACVSGGERLIIEADGSAGINISRLKVSGVNGGIKISKENVSGLVDEITELSVKNAGSIRECMQPYINQILNALQPEESSASTSATSENATASGSSPRTSCAAYAGPDAANSTCSDADGKSVSSRAAKDGSTSSGKIVD